MAKTFHIHILANEQRQLYVGVTSRLQERLWEHRTGATPGYSSRHEISRLVYWEQTSNARTAITREKQLKGMRRIRKLELIERFNPEWRDVSAT